MFNTRVQSRLRTSEVGELSFSEGVCDVSKLGLFVRLVELFRKNNVDTVEHVNYLSICVFIAVLYANSICTSFVITLSRFSGKKAIYITTWFVGVTV